MVSGRLEVPVGRFEDAIGKSVASIQGSDLSAYTITKLSE